LVLTLKIETDNNNIVDPPLIYASRYEQQCKEYAFDFNDMERDYKKYLITLESKKSEKHMNESIKLMYIYNLCMGILKKNKDTLNFKKAFVERNGLYDYCVSIIQAIYSFCNLIINTNKIHELYLSTFIELASEFFKNKDLFIDIINDKTKLSKDKIKNKEIELITKENDDFNNFNYKQKIEIIKEINNVIEILINKINIDSFNFSDNKPTSIYKTFNQYSKGEFIVSINDHYQFTFMKNTERITLDDLNEFNGINNSENNSKIFENYKKWKDENRNQYFQVKNLFEKLFNLKT
jgi:hypothetical protein